MKDFDTWSGFKIDIHNAKGSCINSVMFGGVPLVSTLALSKMELENLMNVQLLSFVVLVRQSV